jgi:hypothetical protein
MDAVGELVDAGVLGAGQGNALDAKLEAAQLQMDRGRTNAAANVLGAFMNQVEALVSSQQLTEEQGQVLIDLAEAAIAALEQEEV